MKPTIPQRLSYQTGKQPPVVEVDLTGKTVCVIGANKGMGFEMCKHFASMNAGRIIFACRSSALKARQLLTVQLKQETGYTKGELWLIDLGDFQSVKAFGDRFEQDEGRLDILVANAAMETRKYTTTKDGWETTLQVNHIAMSAAVLRLVPVMFKTGHEHATKPRIVMVSSDLHYDVAMNKKLLAEPGKILQTMGSPRWFHKNAATQYAFTKLLNIFFARSLTDRLGPDSPLIVNAVAPGFAVSELRRDLKGFLGVVLGAIESMIALTTEEGSRRIVWAAVALPDAAHTLRGQYINCNKVQEASDFAISAEGRKAEQDIWNETLAILGRQDPKTIETAQSYLNF
ncbi:hypothetical protein B0H17DRAFT_1282931 [Mycena rosella]|uniref:Uncharacterized protein n=1 Tax=Mycena rosella TaxID=1033263 RepID=A0AAD7FPX8_MYCRO|nr:hypothetical protein B0H17DRAFT_1282931 [Mycena rosella]